MRPTPLLARALATEATPDRARHPPQVGHATVEELHNQTAAEILAERDGGKSGTMRHFTGAYSGGRLGWAGNGS